MLIYFEWYRIQYNNSSSTISGVYVLSSSVKRSSNVEVALNKVRVRLKHPSTFLSFKITPHLHLMEVIYDFLQVQQVQLHVSLGKQEMSPFLGWNWTLMIGDGNLYRWLHSPVRTSHIATVLSVDALKIVWPLLDQLKDLKDLVTLKSFKLWLTVP